MSATVKAIWLRWPRCQCQSGPRAAGPGADPGRRPRQTAPGAPGPGAPIARLIRGARLAERRLRGPIARCSAAAVAQPQSCPFLFPFKPSKLFILNLKLRFLTGFFPRVILWAPVFYTKPQTQALEMPTLNSKHDGLCSLESTIVLSL